VHSNKTPCVTRCRLTSQYILPAEYNIHHPKKIQRIPPKSSIFNLLEGSLQSILWGFPCTLAFPCTRAPTGALLSRTGLLYVNHSLHAACVGTSVPPIPLSMIARPPHGTRHGLRRAPPSGAANKDPALWAELEALSGLSSLIYGSQFASATSSILR
jgi:hypothetical protein